MNIPFKEDKHYTEDDSILNEIESLTHLYLDDGEEVIDRPWYCMLNTITDNYMMSNQEVIDLAEKNGYIILRLPSVGDFVGGLAIAHKDVNKDAIKADIEKFIEHDEEDRPEVEIKTITKINEEYERVSEEDCRELEKKIENLGFNVVSKRDSGGFSGKDIHYQIITKEGNQTEESFNEYIEKFDEILEDFEDETGSVCTFNMGLQDDGYISCGFDVRAIYYKPGDDVIHVRPQKLYYRNGKPADKGTEATLKQISDVMGFDISDSVPADKKKNEDLSNKTVDLNYDDLEVVFYNQRDVDKFKENKYVINYTYTVDYNTIFNLLEDYLEDDYSDVEELEKYIEDNFDSLVKYYEEDLKADLQDDAVNSAINTVDFDSYGESDSMLESKGDAYALYAFLHKKDGTKEAVNDGKAIEIDSQESIAKKKKEYEDSWNATNTNGTFKFIIRKIREDLDENLTEDVSTIADLKKLVDNIYNKLKGLNKPNVKTTGGEYYGSTELIRTHGNSLELLDEENSYCVQVGGAYEYSDYRAEVTALYDAFPKVAWDIYGDITVEGIRCHLVHKYGSNFSIYGIEFRDTVREDLNSKPDDEEELKAKIKEIVNKYKEDQDSKLGILEVEPGNEAFIQHYDDKDIDFGPFSYHPEGEHESDGATPALITFTLSGGLNGWGELSNWSLYLENVSKLFKELEKETGLHIEIQNIENDIPDDVWTAQVLMYKEDTDLEESLNRLIESLSNHFNKDLGEDIEKHDTLNPVLFDNNELKPEIKDAIQNIADTFVKDLAEDEVNLSVKDIILVGSNVSYNYTKDSDIDIHLIVDSSALDCPKEITDKLYSAYRSIFNRNYDITIKGYPAEIYVELDDMGSAKSNGVYSLNTGWIKEPVQQDIPELDRDAFDELFEEWEEKYLDLLDNENKTSDDVRDFINSLYNLRKIGISEGGESDIRNLVFKEFRNLGYLDGLKDLRKELKGKELSLESVDNSKQLNYNSNDNVTLDDDFNGNVYIDETLNEDAEKGDELTLENVKKWLKSEGATIRNKTRKAVVYKEGYEISLDGSEEKFEDIDLDSENDINKIYEAIIRKVEANEYPYTGIWMEGTTVYVDYSEHFLGTKEEAIKKGYNQKQKTVFNWAYTSEDDKYIPTGYKKEENSSLTKDNSNSIIKEEVKDMHKLTLDNCKLESIFDMYVRYEDMTEEEVEEIYGTREELSDTINYYADLLLDGEKVAELNYANFEGNGDWAELDVHDITSDLLKDTLLKLGYQENVLDVNFTDHDLGRWDDDLKAEWNSTCEEVFKPFLEEVEDAMNKEKEESLNEENQSELNKIAEELYNYLWKRENVSYEIWGDEKDNSINADIEWGDWRHDHLWFDRVAEKWLNEKGYDVVGFNTDVTEEDDSDTYSAIHTLKIQKKQ